MIGRLGEHWRPCARGPTGPGDRLPAAPIRQPTDALRERHWRCRCVPARPSTTKGLASRGFGIGPNCPTRGPTRTMSASIHVLKIRNAYQCHRTNLPGTVARTAFPPEHLESAAPSSITPILGGCAPPASGDQLRGDFSAARDRTGVKIGASPIADSPIRLSSTISYWVYAIRTGSRAGRPAHIAGSVLRHWYRPDARDTGAR